jgi:hypothetical protein
LRAFSSYVFFGDVSPDMLTIGISRIASGSAIVGSANGNRI